MVDVVVPLQSIFIALSPASARDADASASARGRYCALLLGGGAAGLSARFFASPPWFAARSSRGPGRDGRRRVPGTDPAHAAQSDRSATSATCSTPGRPEPQGAVTIFVARRAVSEVFGLVRAARTAPAVHAAGARLRPGITACARAAARLAGSYRPGADAGRALHPMGMGLNLEVGIAGLLDLGFVAFFAVGAYATALLTADAPMRSRTSLLGGHACRGMLSIIVGVLFGVPVLGVRGDYLAVATMGLGRSSVSSCFRIRRAAARRGAGHSADPRRDRRLSSSTPRCHCSISRWSRPRSPPMSPGGWRIRASAAPGWRSATTRTWRRRSAST